jgi:micrococcal nuclease
MRAIPLLVATLLLAGCAPAPDSSSPTSEPGTDTSSQTSATSPPGAAAEVVRIFDGDSLLVAIGDEEAEIRLLGINAPEGTECHGDAARATLRQLLDGGDVTLVSDDEDTDQFGRLLRYVFVDGLNANLALLANGDAIALQSDHSAEADFVAISDAAAAARLGLWAADACGSTPPPADIAIVDYEYNPDGRDEADKNGEWIAVANTGSDTVDMSMWILRDESTQHRFTFPDGFGLGPSQEVRVYSGCGDDSSNRLYWCSDDPVWSNGGDTILLQLEDGTVVSHDRFSGDF